MESTDQATMEQSTTDQPNEVNSDEGGNQSQTFTVNWQELTGEQLLDNYKNLQGEFTRKTQELSQTKKSSELSDDDKAAIEFIKQNGFVTKDDLEWLSAKQAHEASLKEIISANPDLQPFESAIREIWKNGTMAYEDIIQKYWFKAKDKLSKARSQWDIKWTPAQKEKSISDMSTEEYEKYKTKMWWGSNRGTFG